MASDSDMGEGSPVQAEHPSPAKRYPVMRVFAAALFLCVLGYTAVTGYAGFLVARGIDNAKAHSVVTRVATRLMGRDAVERLAIRKGNVPHWMTQSPAFWMTLRANE